MELGKLFQNLTLAARIYDMIANCPHLEQIQIGFSDFGFQNNGFFLGALYLVSRNPHSPYLHT